MSGEIVLVLTLLGSWLAFTLLLAFNVIKPREDCPTCYCQLCVSLFASPIILSPFNLVSKELLLFVWGMGVMGIALLMKDREKYLKCGGQERKWLKEKYVIVAIILAMVLLKTFGVY